MFRNLIISGAGMRGISLVGSIVYLCETHNLHETVMTCVGSSAGALICFLICCGLQPTRMKQIVYDCAMMFSNKQVNIDCIFSMYYNVGIDDGKLLNTIIEKVWQEKFSVSDMTFLEFAKVTGKNLVVSVSNITSHCTEYWSVDTMPNMSITTALKATTAIPIIFPPVVIDDHVYADGSIFNHFPIGYFKPSVLQDSIGLLVEPFYEEITFPLNMFSYITLLVRSVIENINHESIHDLDKNNVILKVATCNSVDTEFDFRLLKYSITPDQFAILYRHGYHEAKKSTALGCSIDKSL